MKFIIAFFALSVCIQIYFYFAARFNIVDNPNQRSSHLLPTIRGGGVIFPLAALLWFVMEGFQYPYFITGLLIVAVIGFADDIKAQPVFLRFGVQLIGFSMLLLQLSFFTNPWWLILVFFVVGIGTMNAFNFMDGINGITGIYGLVTLLTLFMIDRYSFDFTQESLLFFSGIALMIFLFFNFRKRARCFAGDVGSISLSFIIIFLLSQLMVKTQNYGWIILFAVYGTDAVLTILYRIVNRENIFKAHRSHLYQYMVNELGMSHLLVSLLYGVVQLVINLLVILYFPEPTLLQAILITLALMLLYLIVRERILVRLGKRGLIANRYP